MTSTCDVYNPAEGYEWQCRTNLNKPVQGMNATIHDITQSHNSPVMYDIGATPCRHMVADCHLPRTGPQSDADSQA